MKSDEQYEMTSGATLCDILTASTPSAVDPTTSNRAG